jgi:hypothetical protein
VVLAHARALLTSGPQGSCDYIEADLRDPPTILTATARTLDFTKPAAVLLLAVLHFIPDTDDRSSIVTTLASKLAQGSFLAISHLTTDFAPDPVTAGVSAYNRLVPTTLIPRTHSQVSALFAGLPLVPPGVVPLTEWRPTAGPFPHPVDLYAGVAHAHAPPRTSSAPPTPPHGCIRSPGRDHFDLSRICSVKLDEADVIMTQPWSVGAGRLFRGRRG